MPIIPGAVVVPANVDDLSVTLEGARTLAQSYWYDEAGGNWDRMRGSAAGLVVDTELAAAAALTDNFATPTTAPVGAFGMVYDGATWDMMRGTAADGLLVNLGTNNDVDTELSAAAALTDAFATPTAGGVGAFAMGYNGASWDMIRTGLVGDGTAFTGILATTLNLRNSASSTHTLRSLEFDSDANDGTGGLIVGLFGYNGAAWDRLRTAAASGAGLGSQIVHKQNEHNVEVRAASGALSANETSTPVTGLGAYREAVIRLDVTTITTPDIDDEVDFYLQTSYNGGTDWADVENVHFAVADNGNTAIRLFVIGGPQTSAIARIETDGTLADGTKLDLPLGDRIRFKVVITGATAPTYAYNAEASFKS